MSKRQKIRLSIVMPAKNEEKRIGRTLSAYGSYFESRAEELPSEIIVVVNNTDDATSKIVDKYSERYPFIKKLETQYSSGKGGAVALGFKKAVGEFIGFVDADGAIPASEVRRLHELIDETPSLDGVIGTRTNYSTQISIRRRVLMRLYNLYVRVLFRLRCRDTQCGVKIFRRDVAKTIASRLLHTGWIFDVNVLVIAKHMNYKIAEKSVNWSEKKGSKFSIYDALFFVPIELSLLRKAEMTYAVKSMMSNFLPNLGSKSAEHDSKKNVLIYAWRDVKHPEAGGSEVYIHEVAKRLANKHTVTLFTSNPGNLSHTDKIDGVNIVRRGGFLSVYLWAVVYYFRYFRKTMDVIVDVENGIPFFTTVFSRKPKMLLIHHVHKKQWFKQFSLPFAVVGYALESYLMPLLYRGVPIVVVSPSTMAECREIGFKENQIYLGYNSIPGKGTDSYARVKHPQLLYFGRVKAYKQVDIAIRTLNKLVEEYPNMKLVVGGAGDYLDTLKELTVDLGLEDHVEFLGFTSDEDKWQLMQESWVFLMPSIKEGWGITVIEAASCGTPAVGFNVGGIRDAIRNGETGYLAEDEEDFYARTKELIEDKTTYKEMSSTCVDWASMFSWDSTVQIFDSLITYSSIRQGLLSTKVYPWELDLRVDSLVTLSKNK